MPITERVKTPRAILSAVGQNGQGVCKFKCQYCFAAEPSYIPNLSTRSADTIQVLKEKVSDYDVLMLSCDTELFQDPQAALATLGELVPLGKDITFSTKMILGPSILGKLSEIQTQLTRLGKVLSISVSIPMIDKSKEIEIGVPSLARRMAFLRTLKDGGFYPYVGIRPILPPSLVSNEEIGRIVEGSVQNSFGYIIGPYWFKEDKFGFVGDKNLPIFQRKAQWMEDDLLWYVYEDKEREQQIAEIIAQKGGVLYERSSEALVEIKKKYLESS